MFCKNCGKEVNDNAVVCIHCGCSLGRKPSTTSYSYESKKTIGVLLGLFLGLIGLVIGLVLYKSETYERETFVKGWVIGFVVTIVVSIVFGIIYGAMLGSMMATM